ncbi:MAG: protein-L-isoaspartate(D-aspartate) O-methyltransferase [Pseudomonadota bacterium]
MIDEAVGRAELILHLRRQSVASVKVLSAMERVPRSMFLRAAEQPLAYKDRALPIECGQTISQPTVVAMMTEALALTGAERVLEVGTGSGYQTAVLSHLAARVVSVERFEALSGLARERLTVLGLRNVTLLVADGAEPLGGEPLDRVLVTAAAQDLPSPLLDALSPGGVLVAPIGPADGVQTLTRWTRSDEGVRTEALAAVRFVPLRRGVRLAH